MNGFPKKHDYIWQFIFVFYKPIFLSLSCPNVTVTKLQSQCPYIVPVFCAVRSSAIWTLPARYCEASETASVLMALPNFRSRYQEYFSYRLRSNSIASFAFICQEIIAGMYMIEGQLHIFQPSALLL